MSVAIMPLVEEVRCNAPLVESVTPTGAEVTPTQMNRERPLEGYNCRLPTSPKYYRRPGTFYSVRFTSQWLRGRPRRGLL